MACPDLPLHRFGNFDIPEDMPKRHREVAERLRDVIRQADELIRKSEQNC